MAKGVITSIREIPSPMSARLGQMDKEIQYRIEGVGPFAIYIPLEDYDPQKAADLVKAKIAEWAKIVGKEIEVK